VIERQTIKALRQDEDFRHTVAATTREGRIVAPGAAVRIGRGEPIEIPRKD
jgi:hypothetical protein